MTDTTPYEPGPERAPEPEGPVRPGAWDTDSRRLLGPDDGTVPAAGAGRSAERWPLALDALTAGRGGGAVPPARDAGPSGAAGPAGRSAEPLPSGAAVGPSAVVASPFQPGADRSAGGDAPPAVPEAGRSVVPAQPDGATSSSAPGEDGAVVWPEAGGGAVAPETVQASVLAERSEGRRSAARRASGPPADPVRALMHRHRELCEQAVDPLEIAAGLEALGVTDRTAARFRHRDVFSLAEELYARAPRAADPVRIPAPAPRRAATPEAPAGPRPRPRPGAVLRALLVPVVPALACAVVLRVWEAVPLVGRPAVAAGGALAVGLALWWALAGLVRRRPVPWLSWLPWTAWLVAYACLGDGLLSGLLAGTRDPDRPLLAGVWVPLGLACGLAPALWCAHLFGTRARLRLGRSRSLGDFASGVRPLLAVCVLACAAAWTAVQWGVHALLAPPQHQLTTWQLGASSALGLLLFAALLLVAHGFASAAAGGLATACALQALALGSVLLARAPVPPLAGVSGPVRDAVLASGPAVVPAIACGLAAAGLLVHAARAVTGASAHHTQER